MDISAVQSEALLSHSFSSLDLHAFLLKNIASLGFETMTPVQARTLPLTLAGHDVIAQAKTGSGKTAAFGLTLLQRLNAQQFAVQALVLCPTRELADQVAQVLRQLARLMPNIKILNVSGGVPMKPQLDSLRHEAHIIVGTPGRIQKHLDKGSLSLKSLQTLVLDEADRMLDMGFFDAIKDIIALCPKNRQTLLFSATFPYQIEKISNEFMLSPEKIVIAEAHTESSIEQCFFEVKAPSDKFLALRNLLLHYNPTSALVFCNTKEQTLNVTQYLTKERFSAICLHGDMEQAERSRAMIRFVNQSCSILVATDVAARGLDIKELPAVINFDLAFEYDVHIHRIGRTARAGHSGLALTLTTHTDGERLNAIEADALQPLYWGDVFNLPIKNTTPLAPTMATLCILNGRKDKIRPGDILGALIKEAGLSPEAIGKIDVETTCSYIAIQKTHFDKAFKYFQNGTIKGRKVLVKKSG